MDVMSRIERALTTALARGDHPGCPPKLVAAMRHAVFPRGARIRPRLCLAVAAACGEDAPGVSDAAGAAIELLHCASLVHDDLPCFDDADTRRGQPSVHRAFGEPLAVLAGDALIVLAFQTLATGAAGRPLRLGPLLGTVGASVGVPCGIVAGQAWECEDAADLAQYQREKTGALFAAATVAGAAAAGAECEPWRAHGHAAGRGVPGRRRYPGRHRHAARRWASRSGRTAPTPARARCAARPGRRDRPARTLAEAAVEAVPPCLGRSALRSHIRSETCGCCRRTWRGTPLERRVALASVPPLRERVLAWRDRAVASPAFRRLGRRPSRSPGRSRGAARARCSICAPGSSTRRSCSPACSSHLFDILAERPATAAALAPAWG